MPRGGFKFDLGGAKQVWDMVSGNNVQSYAKSGELDKELDAAMEGLMRGDDSGFSKLRSKLMTFPQMKVDSINNLIKGRMEDRLKALDMGDRTRQDTERQAVLKEIMPQPGYERTTQAAPADLGQFGMGGAMADKLAAMDEDEGGDPNAITQYSPGSPGRAPNQSDILRMAGRKAFDSLSGSDDFLTIPQKQGALEQQGRASAALADQRQTRQRLEEMKMDDLEGLPSEYQEGYRPSPRQLASSPSLSAMLPQREKPEDPLLEERRGELVSRTDRNRAQAQRSRQAATTRNSTQGTVLFKEYVARGGDPEDDEAYLDYVQTRSAAGRAPRQTPTGDSMEARAAIAQVIESDAYQQADDATKQQLLDTTAQQFGMKIVGTPKGGPKRGILGLNLGGGAQQSSFSLAPLKSTEGQGPRPSREAAGAPQQQRRAVRVRDKKTGKTGTYNLDPGEKLPANFEVIR